MKPLTGLPRIAIEIDGRRASDLEALALGEVRVEQRLSLPAQCELVFRDPPGQLPTALGFELGAALRATVEGSRVALFTGEIMALEYDYAANAERELRVRAYDKLHRLRKHQSIQTHENVDLGALLREFVGPLGLTVQEAESSPTWRYLAQTQASDLDFLSEMAERSGLVFSQREDVLHVFTLEGIGEAQALALGDTLLEATFEVNGDLAAAEVAAYGWDAERIERFTATADSARSGRNVRAQIDSNGSREVIDLRLENQAQADAAAQAVLDRRTARDVMMRGTAEGDPSLRPGTIIDVDGVDDTIAGRYVVTAATHVISEALGYLTELSTAPPPPRERTRGTITTVGVVDQIGDPERLGRIRVSLPTYNNILTNWTHVVSVGAGSGKGLMALPDVGDDVLVLLAQEDPAQAVVVGGLYGTRGTPDAGIEAGAIRRYTLLTPGGQRIRLDDTNQILRLENSDGSFVELSPERMRVHSNVDLDIEAPGKTIVLRGNAIDFQRA